jgi:hypothetical protein
MHLLIVLAVIVGIAGAMFSLEMTRRAMVGRRMERSIGALRAESLRGPDLRSLAGVGSAQRGVVRDRATEQSAPTVRRAS